MARSSGYGAGSRAGAPHRPAALRPEEMRDAGRLPAPWVLRSDDRDRMLFRRRLTPRAESCRLLHIVPGLLPFPNQHSLFQGCFTPGLLATTMQLGRLRRGIGRDFLHRYRLRLPTPIGNAGRRPQQAGMVRIVEPVAGTGIKFLFGPPAALGREARTRHQG